MDGKRRFLKEARITAVKKMMRGPRGSEMKKEKMKEESLYRLFPLNRFFNDYSGSVIEIIPIVSEIRLKPFSCYCRPEIPGALL